MSMIGFTDRGINSGAIGPLAVLQIDGKIRPNISVDVTHTRLI